MYRNENWEMSKKRYEAWWENDVLDRPIIRVTAPLDGAVRKNLFAESPVREKWWDAEYMVEAQKDALACTYFGGDAFAWFFPNLGTDWISGILGAEVRYTEYMPGHPPFEYTAWAKPFVKDWEDQTFTFNENNEMYKRGAALVSHALNESNDDYAVGFPDIIGGVDSLSVMRGAENLCMDLLDLPGAVITKKMEEVFSVFIEVYDRIHKLITTKQDFAPATLPVWFSGKYFCHVNDFTLMISP